MGGGGGKAEVKDLNLHNFRILDCSLLMLIVIEVDKFLLSGTI